MLVGMGVLVGRREAVDVGSWVPVPIAVASNDGVAVTSVSPCRVAVGMLDCDCGVKKVSAQAGWVIISARSGSTIP